VIVSFVDIGGIVDYHCLNFIFTILVPLTCIGIKQELEAHMGM